MPAVFIINSLRSILLLRSLNFRHRLPARCFEELRRDYIGGVIRKPHVQIWGSIAYALLGVADIDERRRRILVAPEISFIAALAKIIILNAKVISRFFRGQQLFVPVIFIISVIIRRRRQSATPP